MNSFLAASCPIPQHSMINYLITYCHNFQCRKLEPCQCIHKLLGIIYLPYIVCLLRNCILCSDWQLMSWSTFLHTFPSILLFSQLANRVLISKMFFFLLYHCWTISSASCRCYVCCCGCYCICNNYKRNNNSLIYIIPSYIILMQSNTAYEPRANWPWLNIQPISLMLVRRAWH